MRSRHRSRQPWRRWPLFPFCLWVIFPALLLPASPDSAVSFPQDVLPILEQKCFTCHGEAQQMATLDLRTREGALKGGQNGPALVPGDPDSSRLFRRAAGLEEPTMPLGTTLAEEELAVLKRWIKQGAPWGEAASASRAASEKKPAEITGEDRQWWAFQPPRRTAVPKAADARFRKNPIDGFLSRRWREKGLEPAPRAGKRTLIRRAYLDLLGLLPPPEEVDAFVADKSPDAWPRLIERLLASPHYGERWGRHWLDVARYSDSGGYEHDYDYPHAWRYRDYVIHSFNQDKPYNRFILEQLAGDELDDCPGYDCLIATGFHRVGPRVGFREKDNPDYRYNYLDDMIGTTSRAFMALTVDCARCHDHKFDPIRQMDYYRMMAVFFPFVNYDFPLAPPAVVAEHERKKAAVEARTDPLKKRILEIEKPYKELAFEKKLQTFPEDIQIAVRTPEDQRTEGQKLLAAQVITIGVGKIGHLMTQEDRAERDRLQAEIDEIENDLPEPLPMAMGIRDGDYRFTPDGPGDEPQPGKGDREDFGDIEGSYIPEPGKPYNPPKAHFLPTADYRNKGPAVEPGLLKVLHEPAGLTPKSPERRISTGYRRALAEWIASDGHPLTARVMVNRIWAWHFGRGLVSTPSNFGRMGQKPSHPELLDWLATEFVRQRWSIKAMHRLLMTSEAYQMASDYGPEKNFKADPQNTNLWRFRLRRIEAEVIRDIVLSASGKLNPEMGGEPFFPPIPAELREGFNKGKWVLTEQGPDVWRRSIYTYWKRGLKYPMFEVFDQPDPNTTCERRNITTVPTQALTLINNEFVLEQARYFAGRVAGEAGESARERIRAAYRIALSREPTPAEYDANLTFFEKQRGYHQGRAEDAALEALVDLCDVILNLNEFIYLN